MKKYLIGLLSILLLTGCQESRTIIVENIDREYELSDLVTIKNIQEGSTISECPGLDYSEICIIKKDQDFNIIGRERFNIVTNEYETLGVDYYDSIINSPYGSTYLKGNEFNISYKNNIDYENQTNNIKYFIEKDGVYTFICEETYELSSNVQKNYFFEKDGKIYLSFIKDGYLIINEVNEQGYAEVEQKPLQIDGYTLSSYSYDNGFIMEYVSNENTVLKIDEEEYKISNLSRYLIFDDIILVSAYESIDGFSYGEIKETYVIDRSTKEEFKLDETIHVVDWIQKYKDYYYKGDYKKSGCIQLLTYENDTIKIITTSINMHSVDELMYYTHGEYGILIAKQDYTTETIELSLLTLE